MLLWRFCTFFLLLVPTLSEKKLEIEKMEVGGSCETSQDCNSLFLFCSTSLFLKGTCLCNSSRANLVYVDYFLFNRPVPICEIQKCTLSTQKNLTPKGCDLFNSECIPHPDLNLPEGTGFCKCTGSSVGVMDSCQKITYNSVGQTCDSISSVCNESQNLMCHKKNCECHPDFVFSFQDNTCIRKSEFVSKYGSIKLGQYGEYCTSEASCKYGMRCLSKRCSCPSSCLQDFIQTDEFCYCPTMRFTEKYKLILPIFGMVVILSCVSIFCTKKRSDVLLPTSSIASNNHGPTSISLQANSNARSVILSTAENSSCSRSTPQLLLLTPQDLPPS